MAFGLYFRPTGFTTAVYENLLKQLEQAGAGVGKVPGRRFHCAMARLASPSKSSSDATNRFPEPSVAPMFAPKCIQPAALERMVGLRSANACRHP